MWRIIIFLSKFVSSRMSLKQKVFFFWKCTVCITADGGTKGQNQNMLNAL